MNRQLNDIQLNPVEEKSNRMIYQSFMIEHPYISIFIYTG